jgi:hypothetical protein
LSDQSTFQPEKAGGVVAVAALTAAADVDLDAAAFAVDAVAADADEPADAADELAVTVAEAEPGAGRSVPQPRSVTLSTVCPAAEAVVRTLAKPWTPTPLAAEETLTTSSRPIAAAVTSDARARSGPDIV